MLAVGELDAGDGNLVHGADGFAIHRESVVADLAVRNDVVRPHQVELVDLGFRHEFVDVDGPGALERDVVEFVLVDGNVRVGVDLVALDDVLVGDFLAGVAFRRPPTETIAGPDASEFCRPGYAGIRPRRIPAWGS